MEGTHTAFIVAVEALSRDYRRGEKSSEGGGEDSELHLENATGSESKRTRSLIEQNFQNGESW